MDAECGTGGLAQLLRDRGPEIVYRRFDFSPVAVQRAAARLDQSERFFVGDARVRESYPETFDAIVCTEALEHIKADLEAITQWTPGTYCVCSVPNLDADRHVRYSKSAEDVGRRYGALIEIERIAEVKKPFLTDLSLRSRVQALVWSRYPPRRLLAIVGLVSFEVLGGWYVFSGRRVESRAGVDSVGP